MDLFALMESLHVDSLCCNCKGPVNKNLNKQLKIDIVICHLCFYASESTEAYNKKDPALMVFGGNIYVNVEVSNPAKAKSKLRNAKGFGGKEFTITIKADYAIQNIGVFAKQRGFSCVDGKDGDIEIVIKTTDLFSKGRVPDFAADIMKDNCTITPHPMFRIEPEVEMFDEQPRTSTEDH